MKLLQQIGALRLALLFLPLVPNSVSAQDEGDCRPYRWSFGGLKMREDPANPSPTEGIPTLVTVGEINCRYWTTTPAEVNYYTCSQMSERYSISNNELFDLNPGLARDCSNVQPKTVYCVRGFVEPLRAFDGKCGPPNNNATCLGTDKQCCNSQTWTCGDSAADCAPGTCYEGACEGDTVYSTDGTCGHDHGLRLCAGRWGDCCSLDGRCGTGPAHCGLFTCQSGACDIWKEDEQPEGTPWTPDGTCGGAKGYRCSIDWGRCCNVNGICGEDPPDCYVERGCQSAFGICASNSTTGSTSSSMPASSTVPTSSMLISSASPTTSVPLPTPTDNCRDGTGSGGLGGLCSWACAHGYCPSPCTCTPGTPSILPPPTGVRGYALLDLQNEPGFPALCDFVCSYAADYCPEQVCTKVPYSTVPTSGTVCVQGKGDGGYAGLCSYTCRYGYCPPGPCTCLLYGQAIPEPPVLNTPGEPAPGMDESYTGLCSYTCNHGYCPADVCVYLSA